MLPLGLTWVCLWCEGTSCVKVAFQSVVKGMAIAKFPLTNPVSIPPFNFLHQREWIAVRIECSGLCVVPIHSVVAPFFPVNYFDMGRSDFRQSVAKKLLLLTASSDPAKKLVTPASRVLFSRLCSSPTLAVADKGQNYTEKAFRL